MMPSEAAPHSTASIWSTVGVLTRLVGGGGSFAACSGGSWVSGSDMWALLRERLPEDGDHHRDRLLPVHHHGRRGLAAAVDDLVRPLAGPEEPALRLLV